MADLIATERSNIVAIADAVRNKTGNSEQMTIGDIISEINNIDTTKPQTIEEKDVNFWDYDGTLLYSYTLEEVQAMTQLPPLPTQPRLICQGWNWSLERLKEQGYADVGAVYITDDGKTRLIVEITDMIAPMIYLNWRDATVNIDWGDGSDVETNVKAGNHQHEYASVGEYEITLEVVSGELLFNNNGLPIIGNKKNSERNKLKYLYLGNRINKRFQGYSFNTGNLRTVTIPEGVYHIGASEFLGCTSLKFFIFPKSVVTTEAVLNQCRSLSGVSLPEKITTMGRLFQYCSYLKRVNIPNTVTGIASSCFQDSAVRYIRFPDTLSSISTNCCQNCSVSKVELPAGLTSIDSTAFYGCSGLVSLEIPVGVQTIGSSVFYNCNSLVKLRFLPTTPPTVSNANSFATIPTDCIVEVPAASLEAYKNATNYGTIAAQMVGRVFDD